MIEFELYTKHYGTFHFHARYVTLGSDPGCGLELPDESIKPVQCAFFESHDRLFLERKSRYGLTFVNRVPVAADPVEVFDRDIIDIGPYTLMLRSDELLRRDAGYDGRPKTPSDAAIVQTGYWDRVLPSSRPAPADDTTESRTR